LEIKEKDLVDRFMKPAVFDPRGVSSEDLANANPGSTPGPGMERRPPMQLPAFVDPRKTPRVEDPNALPPLEIPDLLVRFIDFDVQVGHTYVYAVQVRMENPNFGRKDVQYDELSRNKELTPSPFTMIPKQITVPKESFFYAVDTELKSLESAKVVNGPLDTRAIPLADQKDKTAVQLQRWVNEAEGGKVIGDWAIAERVVIRRGEYIGRPRFAVEVPVWNELKGDFELGATATTIKGKQPGKDKTTGVPIDFQSPLPAPLLADFVEGYRKTTLFTVPGKSPTRIEEEATTEMLVLTPDGKLIVRNGRDDTESKDRVERLDMWRDRLRQLRSAGVDPGGVNMPGSKGEGR
jgi:hypothetical protein